MLYQVGRWLVVVLLVFMVIGVSACSQKPAQVFHMGKKLQLSSSNSNNTSTKSKVYKSSASKAHKTVTVKRGDTLSELAEKYNVSKAKLIRLNKLRAPYHINVGQKLKLGKAQYHVVKRGDTLYEISKDYDVNMKQLAKVNGVKYPYNVKVGQRLRMPHAKNYTQTARNKKNTVSRKSIKKGSKRKFSSKKYSSSAPRFSWPVRGKIIQRFGPVKNGIYNDGINIAAPEGSSIKAAADGEVVYIGNELKAYGNLLIVKHKNGWVTAYAHTKDILVKRGQRVRKGQKIAIVGKSGKVARPQLHFGLRKGREAVNPSNYLSS